VNLIISKAREAQEQWAKTTIKERVKKLKELQSLVCDKTNDITKIIKQETGKPIIEALNSDVIAGLGSIKYCSIMIKEFLKPYKIQFKGMRLPLWYMGRESYIKPRPLGVIGIISPWNFPFGIPFSQTVMSIAAGNSVILKPSSMTPKTGLMIGELFKKVFPKNLVQVITGPGSKVGKSLVESNIDRLIFTGSVEVGREILKLSAQQLTPVTLELSGKSPMIILEDTDLSRTVKGAVYACFLNAGQVCSGVKRIYVHERILDEFIKSFIEQTRKLEVNQLINERAVNKTKQYIKKLNGKVLLGGKSKGLYFEPTIITNAKQVTDEIFGPVVTITKFSSEQQAINLANNSNFALFASIWTKDLNKGERMASLLKHGSVAVNNHTYTYGLPQTPWGGSGNSGIGLTHGEFGFKELIQPQHVHVDKGRVKQDLWWPPYTDEKLKAQQDLIDLLFKGKYWKLLNLTKML